VFKPLWAIAGVALLGIAGIAGTIVVASPGGEEELVQQVETATPTPGASPSTSASPTFSPSPTPSAAGTPTPSPSVTASQTTECDPNPSPLAGTTLWRWGDMTIMVPAGVLAQGWTENGEPRFVVFPAEFNQSYSTTIDATTGEIIEVSNDAGGATPKDAEIKLAISTISICPLDEKSAPWPYSHEKPAREHVVVGNLRYIEPDRASGIRVFGGTPCGSGGSSNDSGLGLNGVPCPDFIVITSAYSSVALDSKTGAIRGIPEIAEQDRHAFDRYLASIEMLGR